MIVRVTVKRVFYPQDAGRTAGPAYLVPYDLWRLALVTHEPVEFGHSGAYVVEQRMIVQDTTEIPDSPHPRQWSRTWL